ncbi:MAG TPA: ribonuclease HI family protein [Candidatus Angelobacter sp.]|nr:ribonuclease HI family protein [Candidatus Angelobacter sp.]
MTQASLFQADNSKRSKVAMIANTDGGARGNPGPAAFGVVIRNEKGEVLAELSEYLGLQTNNYAEYSGLLAALDYAVRQQCPRLKIFSDSELLVRQMQGRYKVKNSALQELFARAKAMVRKLESFEIEHVLRERNKEADRLVNQILDEHARGAR